MMHEKLEKKTKESIEKILDEGITNNNLEYLYKLVDIYKDAKEVENMNYGNYGNYGNYNGYGEYNGRGPGHGSYGDNYGRRGRDMRYRGDDYIDRMAGEYGRYEESRRYGAGKESDEAYHYMTESLKDFTKYLFETAETPQQKQMLREALQQSMM